jgi:hypothetical protein
MDSCPRFVSGPLLKSSAKISDDPAETNPTEVTTIECGDEPGRLEAFPPMLASTFRCRDALAASTRTHKRHRSASGSPRFIVQPLGNDP